MKHQTALAIMAYIATQAVEAVSISLSLSLPLSCVDEKARTDPCRLPWHLMLQHNSSEPTISHGTKVMLSPSSASRTKSNFTTV